MRDQIRTYYKQLRLKNNALQKKYEILLSLPRSIRNDMTNYMNSDLISKVNFFQFSEPDFVTKLTICLQPELYLEDNYVVKMGEVATKLYFISSGVVEVLATDEKTIIAYMTEGAYFGEIGLLLTQKRSCSVKSITDSVIFTLGKDDLFRLLE
jgi:CRP-like cAMP-binding protein